MQIICPKCSKKFEVENDLIPEKGRLLQCGSCNHKWHFVKKITAVSASPIVEEEKINEPSKLKNKKEQQKTQKFNFKTTTFDKYGDVKKKKKYTDKKSKNNYFKIFLVLIITIIAMIILIDTFKNQIEIIFPNIKYLLNNLYETLKDISLFFKDLIN